MNRSSFGERVRSARQRASMTQVELARALGISESFVGHIERGTRVVSLDTLVALCNTLHVSPHTLLSQSLRCSPPPIEPDFLTYSDVRSPIRSVIRLSEAEAENGWDD